MQYLWSNVDRLLNGGQYQSDILKLPVLLIVQDIFVTCDHLQILSGFGTEALCLFFLVLIHDGTTALIFLSIGVGISGFTISGKLLSF